MKRGSYEKRILRKADFFKKKQLETEQFRKNPINKQIRDNLNRKIIETCMQHAKNMPEVCRQSIGGLSIRRFPSVDPIKHRT